MNLELADARKPTEEFLEAEKVRQDIIRHFDGVLTLCYPQGMDIMYFKTQKPLDTLGNLATRLGEPVQMAIKFDGDVGTTVFMRVPGKTSAENAHGGSKLREFPSPDDGGWMPGLSTSGQYIPEKKDIDFQLLFSGASWRDPVMVVDFGQDSSLSLPDAQARLSYLANAIGSNIQARLGEAVLSATPAGHEHYAGPGRPIGETSSADKALQLIYG